MLLIIDNYDSFTYNLVDYFEQLGQDVHLERNDVEISTLDLGQYCAVVISPGPGKPKEANNLMALLHEFVTFGLPILGICLGHQAIGEYFGWELSKAENPMHGKLSKLTHFNDSIFNGIPNDFNVVRYHSLILTSKNDQCSVVSKSMSGEVMGIKHNIKPIYGVQFHPESVLTEYGLKMLENWLLLNNIKATRV